MHIRNHNIQQRLGQRYIGKRQWDWVRVLLYAEFQVWRSALGIPFGYGLLFVFLLGLLFIPQLPIYYTINVGHEEGYGNDLPFVQGFNTAERSDLGAFRWTDDGATITLAGVGHRPLIVTFTFLPLSEAIFELAPKALEIWSDAERLVVLPVRLKGGSYSLVIPTRFMESGDLRLTLRTETFMPPNDPRHLGTPLTQVIVRSSSHFLPIMPNWVNMGCWLITALLEWVILLRILGRLRRAQRQAIGLMIIVVGLMFLGALFDPPRWALGAWSTLATVGLCYGFAIGLSWNLPPIFARFGIKHDASSIGWLILIVVIAFGLRYGGRLYPESMPGDIGFHTNRFMETVFGRIFLLSRNRGVDFPYPPGPYLILAPFVLMGVSLPNLLQFGAACVEGLSAVFIYVLVMRTWPFQSTHMALLAAALYVFTPAGFLTTWWSFSTHIYTQFAALVSITILIGFCVAQTRVPILRQGYSVLVLFTILAIVFLGHFGFFINMVLLTGMWVGVIQLATWGKALWAVGLNRPLILAYSGALLFALLCFYSAYAPLFMQQAQVTVDGGLTGLAQRAPVLRSQLWQVLWEAGMIIHFGFFPLPLALLSICRLVDKIQRQRGWTRDSSTTPTTLFLGMLMIGSFLVSMVFAVLPFITLSTQSTRWLMFSAWAVAIGAALIMRLLWRCGRMGQVVTLAILGFVGWQTALFWLGPMLWRIRPPEPF